MLFYNLDRRAGNVIRLAGLALVTWSVLGADRHPAGTHGRQLLVSCLLVLAAGAWLVWLARPWEGRGLNVELYVLAVAGGLLAGAAPETAASVFVFVAVVAGGIRVELRRAARLPALGALALAVAVLVYHGGALGLLAYALGFVAALLATSNARQSRQRAEQAELLLAQAQRSHEEQLKAARLQESTRIAREIHDVLAHTLAGLTIQLEATAALIEQGTEPAEVLDRVRAAHRLAREGLTETRRAVGALREDSRSAVAAAIEALVAEHRALDAGGSVELRIEVDREALSGRLGETILRVTQEALTNVQKHAPGADVRVLLRARSGGGVELLVENGGAPALVPATASGLLGSGGGFGLLGMRERAEQLGGSCSAGPLAGGGWRVQLGLPGRGSPS